MTLPELLGVTTASHISHLSEGAVKGEIRLRRLRATRVSRTHFIWSIRREDFVEWFNGVLANDTTRDKAIKGEMAEVCRALGLEFPKPFLVIGQPAQADIVDVAPDAVPVADESGKKKTGF